MVDFDSAAQWDSELLVFWANQGKERIRCLAGRETIAELKGFTHADTHEIARRKLEIKAILEPFAKRKIEKRAFDITVVHSVTLYMHDLKPI